MNWKFDATFEAFKLLNDFVEEFGSHRADYTAEQIVAVHNWADKIAEKLTRPEYVYCARQDASGNYIPPEKRTERAK